MGAETKFLILGVVIILHNVFKEAKGFNGALSESLPASAGKLMSKSQEDIKQRRVTKEMIENLQNMAEESTKPSVLPSTRRGIYSRTATRFQGGADCRRIVRRSPGHITSARIPSNYGDFKRAFLDVDPLREQREIGFPFLGLPRPGALNGYAGYGGLGGMGEGGLGSDFNGVPTQSMPESAEKLVAKLQENIKQKQILKELIEKIQNVLVKIKDKDNENARNNLMPSVSLPNSQRILPPAGNSFQRGIDYRRDERRSPAHLTTASISPKYDDSKRKFRNVNTLGEILKIGSAFLGLSGPGALDGNASLSGFDGKGGGLVIGTGSEDGFDGFGGLVGQGSADDHERLGGQSNVDGNGRLRRHASVEGYRKLGGNRNTGYDLFNGKRNLGGYGRFYGKDRIDTFGRLGESSVVNYDD